MPTWKDLPLVFKCHLVKKLDLRSRNSLRSCSQIDKEIVDECPIVPGSLDLIVTHGNGIRLKIRDGNDQIVKDSLGIADVVLILRNPLLRIQDFRTMSPSSQSHKITGLTTQLSSLKKTDQNFKIHAKNLYWRCSPPETLDTASTDFLHFLECFDENVLEMIHNDMNTFTPDQLEKLGATKQWKHVKAISMGNGQVESVEPFLHVKNCTVYFKKLDAEAIWKMIQSFIKRDFPVDSSFDFYNESPPKLLEVFKAYKVKPKHQPIFPDDIGVEDRHTQRFRMPTEGNFLVVKNTESGIRGEVMMIEE